MKKNIFNNKLNTEDFIINKYFSKLNFGRFETFNYKNDAAFLKCKKNHKIITTNDTIVEGIDFYKNNEPQSIAQKIITTNLSDLSAMGATPYSYMLSLCLSRNIDLNWLKKFSYHLFKLQKKYNFFLLGGDLSKSKQLVLSGTFYGYAKSNYIISQNKLNINDDIWVTGNLGESYFGYKINKYNKFNLNKKIHNYFIKKYLFPEPCMLGYKISKYCSSAIDISDGFFGDLNKMLNNQFGAVINTKHLPISASLIKLLNKKIINLNEVLNWGDDYELIFTAKKSQESLLKRIAKKNNTKITKVGYITKKQGICDNFFKDIDFCKFDHFA